ncbi:serpin-ZX-like [Chenopodium quinoa]|uniref:serpin-ZX-like n=1 Tax=Chenopodium quinoa TaxID=63459 RepID=UPI000B792A38|nr:serpin-ZX-like [Chenopodium quinoa]
MHHKYRAAINHILPPLRIATNEKFDASRTMEGDFFLLNGDSVKVPFMTSYKEQYIKTFDDFKVLRLPYKQGEDKRQFSMYIFLPNVKDGLSNLVQKVCSRDGFVNNNLVHCEKVLVDDFRLPKFKISFGFEASEVLKNLGVELPFMGGGLMKVIDSYEAKYLYVSSIIQKSFIEINEEGTEAAAATAIQASVQCLMIPKVVDFVAYHPFMFLIREGITGAVLFTGHIINPLSC